MADEKTSTPVKTESSAPAKPAAASTDASTAAKSEVGNGKGDAPRNCFSESYRSNFDTIDWSK